MITVGLGNVRIAGASGKTYTFRAYPLDTRFAEFGAVYFITGRTKNPNGRITHSRIYCGETANLSVCPYSSQQSARLKANYANCICVLPVREAVTRREIEKDIHGNYRLLVNA